MKRGSYGLLVAIVLAACGEESPTDVGGSLLPGGAVRTVELILEPERYLVNDTSFSGYTPPSAAGFVVLANAFGSALDARVLARFTLPLTITVQAPAGGTQVDSMPAFFAGRLVLRLDTLASTEPPVEVQVFQPTERWDAPSATWTLRSDTSGAGEPWAEPGGSPGEQLGSTEWAGTDSVVVALDSATIAAWRDTTAVLPGVVVTLGTPGARLRALDLALRVDARSTIDPDTVVTASIGPSDRTFIFQPAPAEAASEPRVGGLPSWRAILQLREGLDTLTFACPEGPPGCRLRLSQATINQAALQLEPIPPPAGFLPEDSVLLGARTLLVSPRVPLPRSLPGEVAGLMTRAVAPSRFENPSGVVELPITEYVRRISRDTTELGDVERPPPYLLLLPAVEASTFGFSSFASLPRLRLILTVTTELQPQ